MAANKRPFKRTVGCVRSAWVQTFTAIESTGIVTEHFAAVLSEIDRGAGDNHMHIRPAGPAICVRQKGWRRERKRQPEVQSPNCPPGTLLGSNVPLHFTPQFRLIRARLEDQQSFGFLPCATAIRLMNHDYRHLVLLQFEKGFFPAPDRNSRCAEM